MFRSESFWLVLVITTPSFVVKFTSWPLKSLTSVHQTSIGRSPFVMMQVAATASSKFTSWSSPNENGVICGKTKFKWKLAMRSTNCKILELENGWREIVFHLITKDGQICAILSDSRAVPCIASVIAAMLRLNRLDVDHAQFISRLSNHYTVAGRQVSFSINRVRQRPPDLDGQVAFVDRAHRGNWFLNIHGIVAELEGNDLREDWMNSKIIANWSLKLIEVLNLINFDVERENCKILKWSYERKSKPNHW